MRVLSLLIATILLVLTSVPSNALILKYKYQGLPMPILFPDPGEPSVWVPYDGYMIIDEAKLPGGTLVNASIAFSWDDHHGRPNQTDGLLALTVIPFPAVAGGRMNFTTDASRHLVSWSSSYLDGPPDGGVTSSGDYVYIGSGSTFLNRTPGKWTLHSIVPVPASLPLLVTGFAALGLLSRWRRGKT